METFMMQLQERNFYTLVNQNVQNLSTQVYSHKNEHTVGKYKNLQTHGIYTDIRSHAEHLQIKLGHYTARLYISSKVRCFEGLLYHHFYQDPSLGALNNLHAPFVRPHLEYDTCMGLSYNQTRQSDPRISSRNCPEIVLQMMGPKISTKTTNSSAIFPFPTSKSCQRIIFHKFVYDYLHSPFPCSVQYSRIIHSLNPCKYLVPTAVYNYLHSFPSYTHSSNLAADNTNLPSLGSFTYI